MVTLEAMEETLVEAISVEISDNDIPSHYLLFMFFSLCTIVLCFDAMDFVAVDSHLLI